LRPSLLAPSHHEVETKAMGQVEMTFKTEFIFFLIVIMATLVVARMVEGIIL
jgi:hypothetical protein